MRRLLTFTTIAAVAVACLASAASAATKLPVITSFSPSQVPVNGTLTIKGRNFGRTVSANRVFFRRADGKVVRVRPRKASTKRLTVVVPSAITKLLTDDGTGGKKATRFQVAIFTKNLGKYTSRSRSPIILPAGTVPTTPLPGGTPGLPPGATAADCDADGTPNTTDTDDDNDLIGDDTEGKIGTDPCKVDSDGDGIEDGYEYFSALDLNGNNLPYPGTRPFPNPLDASDGGKDFDRDGLADADEFAAWIKFGSHTLPLNYSAGNANTGGAPIDGNKDADGDGLANVTELARAATDPFNPARKLEVAGLFQLDWLNADSDGDTINDGADDQDHDGLSNIEEITAGDDNLVTDPEDPSSGSPDCDADGTPNSTDSDDDNDLLSDTVERNTTKTSPCNKDTDGDGVEDGYEQASAVNLNGNALPYPGKRPFPNALDGTDAAKDFDGDGMTQTEEFALWIKFGGHAFPLNYSDGDQTSPAGTAGSMDLDNNGRITDDEKDADGDGLPNWVELSKGEATPVAPCAFAPSTGPAPTHYSNAFTDCGAGLMPNGLTFGNVVTPTTVAGTPPPAYLSTQRLDYKDPDTDGDGLNDSQDDNDFDGLSNFEEITAGTDGFFTEPQDPCDPNTDASTCPIHPSHG
jgi:hypothetical protein